MTSIEDSLLQMAPDAMLVVDQFGQIAQANALAERLFGYPPGMLAGVPLDRLIPARLRDLHRQHTADYLRNPRHRPMDAGPILWGLRHDGSEFAAQISLNPLPTPTGVRTLAAVRDVSEYQRTQQALEQASTTLEQQVATRNAELLHANAELRQQISERNLAEARLQASNRALRLRSACNQALVKATDETALLNEVCRLVVEIGTYRLAWVGLAEQDEDRTVRPIGQAGYEAGYLESIRVTWADEQHGQGPTGKAIRTRRPVVAQNLLTDPHYTPWRVEAARRGYASSIALPLCREDTVLGALNIYAAEPSSFDAEETQLLAELADDLAYGLATLRGRIERQRMAMALEESEERFRQLAEAAFEGIAVSQQGRLIDANHQLAEMLGYAPAELIGRHVVDFVPPEARDLVADRLRSNTREPVEHAVQRKDGSTLFAEVRVRSALYRGKSARISAVRDVTERRRAEQEWRKSEERLTLALRAARAGAWEWEAATNQAIWSDDNYRVLGLAPGSLAASYENWLRCVHPDDRAEAERRVAQVMARGDDLNIEFRVVWSDGSIHWVNDIGKMQFDASGKPVGMHGIQMDITERKQAEEALFDEKERAQVTLHSIGDAVITTDARAVVEYLNPVAEALTGWTTAEAQGRSLSEVFRIVNEQTRQPAPDPVARCLAEGKIVGLANHTVLIGRHGAEYHIDDSAAPIRARDGRVLGAVLVFHDVTETRRLTRQLEHDATHDALTGLINRQEFERRLARALASAQRYGQRHVLCYLDLDQFKVVNDTAGHAAGDELLKQINVILSGMFRERDTLARIGGDEFGLLLDNCPLDRAQVVAQTVVGRIGEHRFQWEGRTYQIGASLGLAPITADTRDTAQALTQADVACYIAKELGRNRVHLYQQEDSETVQRHGEILGAAGLRDALDRGRFRLHYQPILPVNASDPSSIRYEALLRVAPDDSPGGDSELVLPAAFIPAAERYGLMGAIDRWVIQSAFRDYAGGIGRTGAQIAINLSGNSLSDETLLDFIEARFAEHGIPPDRVCFEITETAAIQNLRHASELMVALKRRGSQFALDDFGSGLSSFHYLKSLPVDYLKIDGSFVKDMIENAHDRALVAAINEMSHTLGIQTVAEHVHSQAIVERLRELDVDFAQGYFLGVPMPWGASS